MFTIIRQGSKRGLRFDTGPRGQHQGRALPTEEYERAIGTARSPDPLELIGDIGAVLVARSDARKVVEGFVYLKALFRATSSGRHGVDGKEARHPSPVIAARLRVHCCQVTRHELEYTPELLCADVVGYVVADVEPGVSRRPPWPNGSTGITRRGTVGRHFSALQGKDVGLRVADDVVARPGGRGNKRPPSLGIVEIGSVVRHAQVISEGIAADALERLTTPLAAPHESHAAIARVDGGVDYVRPLPLVVPVPFVTG